MKRHFIHATTLSGCKDMTNKLILCGHLGFSNFFLKMPKGETSTPIWISLDTCYIVCAS